MANESIRCSVNTCKYNSHSELCDLNSIEVGKTATSSPKNSRETECSSFECQ